MNEPLPMAEVNKRRAEECAARPRTSRSRVYLRLLLAIPGIALLIVGLSNYTNVEDNGRVDAIKLTTKPGMVGQASEAIRLVEPGNPDLYLRITIAGRNETLRTQTYKDVPVGNGLVWQLVQPALMTEIKQIDVWDENLINDNQKDHILLSRWSAEGQTFRIDLLGQKNQPPNWAMPMTVVGGTIVLLIFLRFVWDQVI